MPDARGSPSVPATGYADVITVARVPSGCCFFAGSVEDYQVQYDTWVLAVRPERCPHCGAEHAYIFWGSYARHVRLTTHRLDIRIGRVRCSVCHVTDALLPSFLHMFRHYALFLIQQAISLTIDRGLWGDDLADAVGPYNQPAFSTLHGWVWSFALSAEWLLPWLQQVLLAVDPVASLDPGRPPAHLQAIHNVKRRAAFTRAWQTLRLAEALYAATRERQKDLAFRADMLLAFVAAALGAAGRVPRLLWPQAAARAPA
jgi:transposase